MQAHLYTSDISTALTSLQLETSYRAPVSGVEEGGKRVSRLSALAIYELAAPIGKARRDTVTVDIASLIKGSDSNESTTTPTQQAPSTSASTFPPARATTTAPPIGPPPPPLASFAVAPGAVSSQFGFVGGAGFRGFGASTVPGPSQTTSTSAPALASRPVGVGSNKRSMPPHTSESPAKKQSKWSPEEDALIIELRGSGMKWDDISKRLPGRSSISCRLHYQNYLERRSEWDEERKNKLARLYERFKPEMWAKVAEEMQVPWRAAEAMHWQLGENEMARRAGVVPFTLNMNPNDSQGSHAGHHHLHHRISPTRGGGHGHSQSQGSLPTIPSPRYHHHQRGPPPPSLIPPPMATGRPLAVRRESLPPRAPEPLDYGYGPPHPPPPPPPGPPFSGLAPIQTTSLGPGQGRGGVLPSVAELTTGISPYSTPAYSVGAPSASPIHSATASPVPLLPPLGYSSSSYGYSHVESSSGSKRRASPDVGRETSRRRHMYPRSENGDYPPLPPPPPPPMGLGPIPARRSRYEP
ncbi:hypothetical protein QBC40DRAFT_345151 [Triangularia verruculosa]|uniref:MYB transcription factor n=1 Tax=Triangularia verruculosa TaxID=2587418 RepID=A0AAN6XU90_9PEZI|nr:hypothetical protein QBC40DRAFT_345151 [Triangularia verruculosa]